MSSPLSPNFNPAYPTFPQQQPAAQGPIPGAESFGMPQSGLSGMPQLPPPLPQDTFGAPQPNGAPTPDMQAFAQAMGQQQIDPAVAAAAAGAPQTPPAGAQQANTPQAQSGIQEYPGGGFAESASSEGSGLASSIFSLKGLAIGAATIAAGIGLHRVITGHWIGQAKDAAVHTWESAKTTVDNYINQFQEKVKDPINNAISSKNKANLDGVKKSFTDEVITPAETLSTDDTSKPFAATLKKDFNELIQKAEDNITAEKTDALAEAEFTPVEKALKDFRDKVATPKASDEAAQKAKQAEANTTSTETGTTGKDDAITDKDSITDDITKRDDGIKPKIEVPSPKKPVVEPAKTEPSLTNRIGNKISSAFSYLRSFGSTKGAQATEEATKKAAAQEKTA
ncbi:MAG: hypothetical protein K0Q50_2602 [Vampirovibrio sp.]|nr:hypothetical protein [Vampirovibrio sp.]